MNMRFSKILMKVLLNVRSQMQVFIHLLVTWNSSIRVNLQYLLMLIKWLWEVCHCVIQNGSMELPYLQVTILKWWWIQLLESLRDHKLRYKQTSILSFVLWFNVLYVFMLQSKLQYGSMLKITKMHIGI